MAHSRLSGEDSTAGFDIERNDRLSRRYVVLALVLVMVVLVALGSLSIYATERFAFAALERQTEDLKPALARLEEQDPESRTRPLAPQGAYRVVLAPQQGGLHEGEPAVATPQRIQKDTAGLAVRKQQSQENWSAVIVAGQDAFGAGAVTPGALPTARQDSFTAGTVTPDGLAPLDATSTELASSRTNRMGGMMGKPRARLRL